MSVARELSPLSGSGVSARGRSAAAWRKEGESVRAVQFIAVVLVLLPGDRPPKPTKVRVIFTDFWEFDFCQLVKVECRLEMN